MPTGTTIGHIHLQVTDLDRALAFYRDLLGFEVMVHAGSGRLFVGRRLPPPHRAQHLAQPGRPAGRTRGGSGPLSRRYSI
ncbi:MAG: VOC family protein [Hymenobacter sp.]